MSAISLFFKDALEYEKNHQLIIWRFLEDPKFIKILFGIDLIKPKIYWEYKNGLFDLAVAESGNDPELMIELKMFSGLSQEQLQKQTEYIKQFNIQGAYILLGTSNIEYVKNEKNDDIKNKTEGYSQKIGYKELIEGLKKYQDVMEKGSDNFDLVLEYIYALKQQVGWINNCKKLKAEKRYDIYYYTIYQRIRDHHIDGKLYLDVYTEHNRGGPSYIMNDKGTWFEIEFEGFQFKLFQEILDGTHLIRLMRMSKHSNYQRSLAEKISKKLQEKNLFAKNYNHSMRVSKYMKIARKDLDFNNPDDLAFEANLLLETHKILKSISAELNQNYF